MTFLGNPILLLPTSVFPPSGGAGTLETGMLGGFCPRPCPPCHHVLNMQSWGAGRWDLPLGTGSAVPTPGISLPKRPLCQEITFLGEILCATNPLLRSLHDADAIQPAVCWGKMLWPALLGSEQGNIVSQQVLFPTLKKQPKLTFNSNPFA